MQIFNNKSIYIILYYFINNINTYCECYQCCNCCKLCCLICKKQEISKMTEIKNIEKIDNNITNTHDNEIIYNSKINNNEELLNSIRKMY